MTSGSRVNTAIIVSSGTSFCVVMTMDNAFVGVGMFFIAKIFSESG